MELIRTILCEIGSFFVDFYENDIYKQVYSSFAKQKWPELYKKGAKVYIIKIYQLKPSQTIHIVKR